MTLGPAQKPAPVWRHLSTEPNGYTVLATMSPDGWIRLDAYRTDGDGWHKTVSLSKSAQVALRGMLDYPDLYKE